MENEFEEWCQILEITPQIKAQMEIENIKTAQQIAGITVEDLEKLGVSKIGSRIEMIDQIRTLKAYGPAALRWRKWAHGRRSSSLSAAAIGNRDLSSTTFHKKFQEPSNAPGQVCIKMGYNFRTLNEIDCVLGRFSCSFKVFATWVDPCLKNVPDELARKHIHTQSMDDSRTEFTLSGLPGVFDPQIVITNATRLRCTYHEIKVSNRMEGRLKWTKYFSGELSLGTFHKNLKLFPFDFHDLAIIVRSHKLELSRCLFQLWKGCHTSSLNEYMGEWAVLGHRGYAITTDPNKSTSGKVYSEFRMVIMVQRCWGWYFLNIFFFLFSIMGMALLMFLIPYESRLEPSISLVLSVIATKFTCADHIPRLYFSTIFDEYMAVCFGFVVVTVLEMQILFNAEEEHHSTNFWSGVVVASIFTIYHIGLAVRVYLCFRKKTLVAGLKSHRICIACSSSCRFDPREKKVPG